MEFQNEESKVRFKNHKDKIRENIKIAEDMGINKISAILAIEDKEVQSKLINWLITDGYKVSLKREDYSILTIEW